MRHHDGVLVMGDLRFDDVAALKPGDVFYECEMGVNIRARVTTAPMLGESYEGRKTLSWKAENTENGNLIDYMLTEGLGHYGPRLYTAPQYCKLIFPLVPCPFCGETEHLSIRSTGSLISGMPARPYRVICSHIDHDTVSGPVGYGLSGATAAWNRRANTDAALLATVTRERDEARALGYDSFKLAVHHQARATAAEAALAAIRALASEPKP